MEWGRCGYQNLRLLKDNNNTTKAEWKLYNRLFEKLEKTKLAAL